MTMVTTENGAMARSKCGDVLLVQMSGSKTEVLHHIIVISLILHFL